MINENNLSKLYEGLIEGKELTTKELSSYGFKSNDLTSLIENGTLERVKKGYYSFKSIDELFYYGKKLIAAKEYEKATTCFERCYELNPNHLGVCFQLFLRCVQKKDYETAFKYFDRFYNCDNKYYNADSDFYLYLLNMVTEIPEKYRQYVKALKFENIRVDVNDKRYEDIHLHNKVRISALNQRFLLAVKQLNKLSYQFDKVTVQDIIIKTLLNQAIEEQKRVKRHVVNLVRRKQYAEVISYLESIKKRYNLSESDELVLSLTKELSDMIETGIVPKGKAFSTDSLFEAISLKNYELALSLSGEYIQRNNINIQDNAMYMLLYDIVVEVKSKKQFVQVEEEQDIEEKQEMVIEQSVVIEEQKNSVSKISSDSSKNTFADIINYLLKQDLDNSFSALKNYLNSINKQEYEFLIIDLIKISLIEQDMAFSKPMIALSYINVGNFSFNINEYIQKFYENLARNKLDEARVYLDIISKSDRLGEACILTDSLEQVLNTTEKMLNYKRNSEVLTKVDQSLKSIDSNLPDYAASIISTPQIVDSKEGNKISSELIDEEPQVQSQSKEEIKPVEAVKDYDDLEFINSKLNDLYEKGIILLKPMKSERRKEIHDIVKEIPDVVSFSVGEGEQRQVVLRFNPNLDKYVDFRQIKKEGDQAYQKKDYDLCIEKYRQLLQYGRPKAFVYIRIGLSYMKKFDKNMAIDYLTVATSLSKKEGTDLDFTELIGSLKGLIAEEDKKPKVRMGLSDFKNDIDNYYGIESIHEVASLVSSGIEVKEACESFGISEEEQTIVGLIFARECYVNENYTLGDQYLKKVERTKNKSKFANSLLEEVRKNKRFYKNRKSKDHKPLVLTRKIKND